jgi:hypothetical protein
VNGKQKKPVDSRRRRRECQCLKNHKPTVPIKLGLKQLVTEFGDSSMVLLQGASAKKAILKLLAKIMNKNMPKKKILSLHHHDSVTKT